MIVVDTSALFAVLDEQDMHHDRAVAELERIAASGIGLAIPNYVASEALSLVSRRLGMDSARAMQRGAIPIPAVSSLRCANACSRTPGLGPATNEGSPSPSVFHLNAAEPMPSLWRTRRKAAAALVLKLMSPALE